MWKTLSVVILLACVATSKRSDKKVRQRHGSERALGLDEGESAANTQKVAFYAGLKDNIGPIKSNQDVIFDKVVTNVGNAYVAKTGHFVAPVNGTYQFTVNIAAQGRQKAAVMLLKNQAMIATVWAESIPYWASASNTAILQLKKGDQVWLQLLHRASYLHGYMYSTFSGHILFED